MSRRPRKGAAGIAYLLVSAGQGKALCTTAAMCSCKTYWTRTITVRAPFLQPTTPLTYLFPRDFPLQSSHSTEEQQSLLTRQVQEVGKAWGGWAELSVSQWLSRAVPLIAS